MPTSGIASEDIRTDYLHLLVTQLRNQNPLEPMDNNDMAMQLAQLSQLEQMENMSTTFQKVLSAANRNHATSLIGKRVTFIPAGATTEAAGAATRGTAGGVGQLLNLTDEELRRQDR